MPFTIFQNSTTAFANEVVNNFYHIADGDRLPREAGSMTAVDLTYNIGSISNRFKNLYANNLYVNSDITSTSFLKKISETTFSTGTVSSDFLISGLNGDNYDYIFSMHISISVTDTVYMYFNNDTGTNYSYRSLFLDNANIIDQTSASGQAGLSFFSTFSSRFIMNGKISCRTGTQRIVQSHGLYGHFSFLGMWSNTSDTITSIGFYTAGAANFNKFSKITFWETK